MNTDDEAHAATPDVRAGGVFAGQLTSELVDGPSKLRSIRCANDLHLAEAYAGLTGIKKSIKQQVMSSALQFLTN